MDGEPQKLPPEAEERPPYESLKQPESPSTPDTASHQITIRRITSEDWQAYRDFYKDLKDKDPSHPHMFNGLLEGRDLDARATYTNLFNNTINTEPEGSWAMFGLWAGSKMIGNSSVIIPEPGKDGKKIADFEGSEIAPDYRGRRLLDKFYEVRMRHLKEIGFQGEIRTQIRPDNDPSLKAAKRNGFAVSGDVTEHGKLVLVRAAPATQETPTPPTGRPNVPAARKTPG